MFPDRPAPLSEKDLASIGAGMDEVKEDRMGWIKVPFNPNKPDGHKVTLWETDNKTTKLLNE